MRTRVLVSRIIYILIISLTVDRPNMTSKSYTDTIKVIDCSELSLYEKIPSILTSYLLFLQYKDIFYKKRN